MTGHIDPVPALILSLALAGLWAAAGLHKLLDLRAFSDALSAYALLPRRAAPIVARALPLVEIGVACGILLSATRSAAGLASALLLGAYALAIAVNLRRGRRQLDCGCVGFGARTSLSVALLWRNGALLLVSLAAGFLPRGVRTLDWIDVFTVAAGVAAAALLYAVADALASSAERLPRHVGDEAHG
ncbi:MAG TPA: MauE/DoxX family redox-associated membrane protein [Steroidobacteraceae bacterium]|nr:MauE/DoxX family redox-associated membrane protein [Steroidobacteraceae bacterium]